MKQSSLLLFSLFCILVQSPAQFTRYIVKFKDKGNSSFTLSNPIAYLSQRAIDRRSRYNISIDSSDLPVTASYISQIKNITNVTFLNASKWLNAVTIQTSDPTAITAINSLPFVKSVNGIAAGADKKIIRPLTSLILKQSHLSFQLQTGQQEPKATIIITVLLH